MIFMNVVTIKFRNSRIGGARKGCWAGEITKTKERQPIHLTTIINFTNSCQIKARSQVCFIVVRKRTMKFGYVNVLL